MKKSLLSIAFCLLLSLPAFGQDLVAADAPAPNDQLKVTLKRLVVGNQGAILKIWKAEGGAEPDYYRGLDDRDTAPYSADDQSALVSSLGYTPAELEAVTLSVMDDYGKLPKKNALAFLGLVHSIDDASPLEPNDEVDAKLRKFLLERLKEDKSVIMRRQACLSLAVGDTVDAEMMEEILTFFAGSENLWETFPVQQFFEYHAEDIRALPNYTDIRDRVAAVNSLYTPNILSYLNGN